jgi:hypothetical protein
MSYDRLSGIEARFGGRSAQVQAQPVVVANGASGKERYIRDTSTYTGTWNAVQIIADAVFDAASVTTIAGLSASGDTFSAGTILYGYWSTVKLSSGKVIAY